jgi:predicted RNase H-like nuclease (RuvC/YqgF family)
MALVKHVNDLQWALGPSLEAYVERLEKRVKKLELDIEQMHIENAEKMAKNRTYHIILEEIELNHLRFHIVCLRALLDECEGA